ncbi:MAG: sugar ABC transporter permease, partial [Spirochaetales bacterium]|nr:sugar ABC transporter permease [Spirochaetales bacterium]
MRSISREIFEASVIDGAGAARQFFAITVPLINPTILLIITLDIINSFRVFGEIISTTEGGPGGATESIMIYLVQDVFPFDYGRASAISVMVIVFLLSVSIVQRLFRRSVQY